MFRKRKFVRAPSMLSAKGNTIFPKGNAVSAKGNIVSHKGNAVSAKGKMLSAEGNMVFAEGNHFSAKGNTASPTGNTGCPKGNLETSCAVRNRGSKIQRERKFRKTHFLNVFRSSLEDADVAKRPKILKNPGRRREK